MSQTKTVMADGQLSPKAIVAALLPLAATVVAVLTQFAITREFDLLEIVTAASGAATSLLALVGAWAASPGETVVAKKVSRKRRKRHDDAVVGDEVRRLTRDEEAADVLPDAGGGIDSEDVETAKAERERVRRARGRQG